MQTHAEDAAGADQGQFRPLGVETQSQGRICLLIATATRQPGRADSAITLLDMPELLSRDAVRVGSVRGPYFRENFAQGGIDLVQIIPELVTNADAAIADDGRERGRIELAFGAPDAGFLRTWRAQMRALKVPALLGWRHEVRCVDDGIGVDAGTVDRRLGALGELPEHGGRRGLFGRGLRDVWLAQGAGRIEGTRAGRAVESWFFPAAGDDPYAYLHVRDEAVPGIAPSTRVTVPLATARLPVDGRLRTLVSQLVQLRPVLEDPAREVWLELPSGAMEIVRAPQPEPERRRTGKQASLLES